MLSCNHCAPHVHSCLAHTSSQIIHEEVQRAALHLRMLSCNYCAPHVQSCLAHTHSDHPRGGTACCPAAWNAMQSLCSSRAVMSCTHLLRSPTRRYSMLPCSMECYAIIVLLTCSHVLHTPTQIIHEEVQHAALQLGMIPLQRLSAQHATTLSRVAGAIPINSWHPTASDSWRQLLGVVGGVRQQVRRHRERC